MIPVPEVEKMKRVQAESQAIGRFLDWMLEKKRKPTFWNIEQLLAEYYGIDLQKVEKEKMKILEEFRSKK